MQRCEHYCIVKLIEILEDQKHFYFVMDLLKGKNLQDLTSDDDSFYTEK